MKRILYPAHSDHPVISWSSLILRIVFGLSMIFGHGWRKLMVIIGGDPIKFADPIGLGEATSLYLAVFAELFCALLIVIGLFSRGAVIPLIITMLVALLVIHGSDPFSKKEMALLYAAVYFCILLLGPGKFSLDHFLFKPKQRTE